MKLSKKLALTLLSGVFALGVGANLVKGQNGILTEAAEIEAASADFTTMASSSTSYTKEWTYDTDWQIYGGANNGGGWPYVKMGGKSENLDITGPNVYIRNLTVIPEEIDKVTVTTVDGSFKNAGMTVNSWGLYVYSDSANANQIDYVEGGTITKTGALYDFYPTSGTTWPASSYFKVNFNVSNTTTKNGIVCVSDVTFYYQDVEILPTGLTVNLANTTIERGATTKATATLTPADTSNKDVTWSTSDESIAAVDFNGNVTAINVGNVDIIATSVADPTVKGMATLTVTGTPAVDSDKFITVYRTGYKTSYADDIVLVDNVSYARNQVMRGIDTYTTTLQFKASVGTFANLSPFPSAVKTVVVTLFRTGTVTVYGGNTASTATNVVTGTQTDLVVTYDFSANDYTYFKIANTSTAAVYINSIEIQLQGTQAENTRAWAQNFLDNVTCLTDGSVPPTQDEWTNLGAAFNALTLEEQAVIKDCTYSTTERDYALAGVLEQAVMKYDYIVNKYGEETFANFMNRTIPAPLPDIARNYLAADNTQLIALGLIFITAIATFIYIKSKRKQYN